MKNRTYILAVILTATLLVAGVTPGAAKDINSNAGTSAFPFLKINIGARAVAMGGAFTGLADDEASLYYNPAGIASFEEKRFILGYHNYVADIQTGFVGYIHSFDAIKSAGLYVSYLNYGEFTETDEFGNTIGDFGGGDFLMAASFAFKTGYHLSFGATAKFIYEKVQEFSATGMAIDIGGKYAADRDVYSLGLMIQNLGAQLSALGEEKDKLPISVRAGGAYTPRGVPITISSDLILPFDNDLVIAIGGEYLALRPFYARVGWNTFGSNFRAGDSDDKWAGFSVGMGFDIRRINISYAFSPSADLGESHRITLTGGL
ncbi:MAG: PorV/PorQ family protein [Candidatus Zixiibacteriota bacterium]|nr:MAG: PorV/PorQ family protein [candidate division Zixibacteria bacterium]